MGIWEIIAGDYDSHLFIYWGAKYVKAWAMRKVAEGKEGGAWAMDVTEPS